MTHESDLFVVAHDFSRHADAALIAALDLSSRFPARLMLLHVVSLPILAHPSLDFAGAGAIPPVDLCSHASEALQDIRRRVGDTKVSISTEVVEGHPVDGAIVDYCVAEDAALLIMGTHGRTGMAHAFIGSVAERTLRRAPCPVLTVNAKDEEDGAR